MEAKKAEFIKSLREFADKEYHEHPELSLALCKAANLIIQLEQWKYLTLNTLTDDQLDFKPSASLTLRQRLSIFEDKGR